MLYRLILIILLLVNSIFGGNYEHQPFNKDSEIEYLSLERIQPNNEIINSFCFWANEMATEKYFNEDGHVIVPSEKYFENSFNIGEFLNYNYGKGPDRIYLRSFIYGNDRHMYMTIQEEDEEYFFGEAYHFTDLVGVGELCAYSADLNQDGQDDYVIMKFSGGNGLAAGNCDVGFILSSDDYPRYTFSVVHSMFPDPEDFVILNGKPYFIHCEGDYAISKDKDPHYYWVYNLISFDEGELKVSNQNFEEFPKTIWYTYKPNNSETTFLKKKVKDKLTKESLPNIIKKEGELAFDWRTGVNSIINKMKAKDKEELSKIVSYPLKIRTPYFVENEEDFLKHFNLIFTDEAMEVVGNSKFENWSQVGWRGVMFGQGLFWADYVKNGKITKINQYSEETGEAVKRANENMKSFIHESVSDYIENLNDWTTSRYRIRLDTVEDDFRLTLWNKEDDLSDEPYFSITGRDEYEYGGTGGYYTKKFIDEESDRVYIIDNSFKWGLRFIVHWDFGEGIENEAYIIYCDDLTETKEKLSDWDSLTALGFNPNKHLIVNFEGIHEGKYEISAIVEPWQDRMSNGVDCYTKYIIKNIKTGRMCYFDHFNLNLPKDEIKTYLMNEIGSDGMPKRGIYSGVTNSEEFKLILKNKPNSNPFEKWDPYYEEDGGWIALDYYSGDFFSFIDIDFDGKKEIVVTNYFASQRACTGFDVYDLDVLEEDYEGEDYMSVFQIKEIKKKQHEPLDSLDTLSVIDLANKFIYNHASCGAGDSYGTEYNWFEGGRYDGWMPAKRYGADDGEIYTHEYKHSPEKYVEDGYYWKADMYVEDGWRTNIVDVTEDK